jgi:hypothetical protein
MLLNGCRASRSPRSTALVEASVDLKRLSRAGVEVFFRWCSATATSADVPRQRLRRDRRAPTGNTYVDFDHGRCPARLGYRANFLAFFARRDYHRRHRAPRIGGYHRTRVDAEAEIRVVPSPYSTSAVAIHSLRTDRSSGARGAMGAAAAVLLPKTLPAAGCRWLDRAQLGDDREADLSDGCMSRSNRRRWRRLPPGAPIALPEMPRLLHQCCRGRPPPPPRRRDRPPGSCRTGFWYWSQCCSRRDRRAAGLSL